MRSALQRDLRHLVLGLVGTLLIAGAIATLIGTLYTVSVALAAQFGDIFRRLLIPGLSLRVLAAILVQAPLWWFLLHYLPVLPRGTTRLVFWSLLVALPLCLLAMVLNSLVPQSS